MDNQKHNTIDERVTLSLKKMDLDLSKITLEQIRDLATDIVDEETQSLKSDLQKLLEKKETIERELDKKSEELQDTKYKIFNAIEVQFNSNESVLSKLHQVKLQSIDLYDILSEMVESAIITALENDSEGDIVESITEVIKEIAYESIKEGSLNTIRVRKILSTILITAIDVAEATPNRAEKILSSTLRGMRSGLIKSIDRFKKRIVFMPVEAKHILIEDYDTIIEDLNQTDTLFSQVVTTQAQESVPVIKKLLLDLNKEMSYDLEELMHISKETAEIIKERFSNFAKVAVKQADKALKSPKAQEAKRMGIQAFGVAKVAIEGAIKSAKDAIENKDKQ